MAVKKRARQVAAATTALAAAMVTGQALSPAQAAEPDTSSWVQTKSAFVSNSWAARVTAFDDLQTVRLHSSRIDCTRSVGRLNRNDLAQTLTGGLADSLEEFGVNLSGLSGTNVTYRENGRTGSRATNVIGDISIAPPLPDGFDGEAGRIVLTNVKTVADAYKDATGYHAETDISWGDLEFKLPTSPQLEPLTGPAQDLVDLLTKTVNDTVVRQVVDLLDSTPVPIEIPGLASFDLGYENTRVGKNRALAGAYGLLIKVADNGDRNGPMIELGRSFARTDGRAMSGVINGSAAAIDRTALLSQYGHSKVPCVGTQGRVLTERFRGVEIPDVATIGAAKNTYFGEQRRRGGLAAWSKSETRFIEIDALQVRLQDVVGRAAVRQRNGRIVSRSIKGSTVGSLFVRGQRRALPAPGEAMQLPGGAVLRTLVKTATGRGLKVASAVIEMGDGQTLRFGVANVVLKQR